MSTCYPSSIDIMEVNKVDLSQGRIEPPEAARGHATPRRRNVRCRLWLKR